MGTSRSRWIGKNSRTQTNTKDQGFTLIELLVVIAIIAVLVSILLPALLGAKQSGEMVRELAAGKHLMEAHTLYAEDNKSNLLPGYATAAMCSQNPPATTKPLLVFDGDGERIYGVQARRYPWRIAPFLDYNIAGIYKDRHVLSDYRSRSDYQYVVSLSPSLGINGTFIGGDADRFGFDPRAMQRWGNFYLTRADQARRPDQLIVFASARGVDPAGASGPTGGVGLVPGYFRVDSPYLLDRVWEDRYEPNDLPSLFGNLDLRYGSRGKDGAGGRAITSQLDGHAEPLGEKDLQDMRRWSDQATTPDWHLP